jgi:hypothetical protein
MVSYIRKGGGGKEHQKGKTIAAWAYFLERKRARWRKAWASPGRL